jgi:hypothetical protein
MAHTHVPSTHHRQKQRPRTRPGRARNGVATTTTLSAGALPQAYPHPPAHRLVAHTYAACGFCMQQRQQPPRRLFLLACSQSTRSSSSYAADEHYSFHPRSKPFWPLLQVRLSPTSRNSMVTGRSGPLKLLHLRSCCQLPSTKPSGAQRRGGGRSQRAAGLLSHSSSWLPWRRAILGT